MTLPGDKHMPQALERIRLGLLKVDRDGSAWSTGHLNPKTKVPIPHAPRRIATNPSPDGYLSVTFGGRHRVSLHRLCYTVHVGPIPAGMTINHRNGVKTDNRIENLEVASYAENNLHAYKSLGKPCLGRERYKITEEKAREIFMSRSAGARNRVLAKAYGVSPTTISEIANGRIWVDATADLRSPVGL